MAEQNYIMVTKNTLSTEIELILPLYDDLASGMVSTNTVDTTKTSMIEFSDCHILLFWFHKKRINIGRRL